MISSFFCLIRRLFTHFILFNLHLQSLIIYDETFFSKDSTEVKALVHASQNANKQQTTKLKIFEKNKKRSFNDIGDSKNEDETRLTKLLKPIDITESDIRYKGPSQNALVHTSAKIRRFEKNTENSRQVVSLEQNSMEVAIPTKQKSVSRQGL